MKAESGRWINFGLVGSADITGILFDGRRLEVEVKTGAGKQTDKQKDFQAMIERFNGVYFLARDVPSALGFLHGLYDKTKDARLNLTL